MATPRTTTSKKSPSQATLKKMYPSHKIRYTVPIDVTEGLHGQLRTEAPQEGMKLGAYVRHLVVTHPKRRKFAKTK